MDSSDIMALFSDRKSKCYHRRGRERYYTTEHHCFLRYEHPREYGKEEFLQCELFCRTRSWTGDHHRREHPPFLNLGLVHSGETAIRCGSFYAMAKAGDLFFLAPDTEYEILTPHLCDRSAALISGPLLRAITAESGLTDHPVLTLPAPEIPGRMLESLGDLLPESSRPAVRRKISNLCFELIQYLHAPDVRSPLPENLKRVLEKIGREYDMPLRREALAREAGISESGLLRLFRRHLGSTPHRYLTEIRMRQAARMLEQHTLSVKEIAARVGYENALNFSTAFRKTFGRSPKLFSAGSVPDESSGSPE